MASCCAKHRHKPPEMGQTLAVQEQDLNLKPFEDNMFVCKDSLKSQTRLNQTISRVLSGALGPCSPQNFAIAQQLPTAETKARKGF